MKYWGPINSTGGINGTDGYVDGNATTGQEGSIPSFSGFEQTLRALNNLVVSAGRTPSATINDFQLTDVVRSQRVNWSGTFGGTANALTSTYSPAPGSAAELVGVPLAGIAAFTNTGTVTYSPNGFTGPVQWPDGTPLAGGEITIGEIIILRWDGTRYQLFTGSSNRIKWTQKLPGFFFGRADPLVPQTLVANVWTKLNAGTEEYDYEGWYNPSTSRFQPTRPGFYYITADASFGSGANFPTAGLRAFLNGNPTYNTSIGDVPGTQYSTLGNGSLAVVSGITRLNGTTDFVEMYGYMDVVDSNGVRTANKLRWGGWFIGA